MYFKVRCIREPIRILLSLASFFFPFSLLCFFAQTVIQWLFSESVSDTLVLILSFAGAGAFSLLCSWLLQFYKIYEFTDRAIQILWWYGGWFFYFNILPLPQRSRQSRLSKTESPLLYREETPPVRGFPDEFEPEIISHQLSQGAPPEAVLGTGKLVKTLHRSELHDVKILESAFGATLLLRLQGCGEFTERFVWQHQLHNRGKLFVLHLSKARGEEAYSMLKEYTRR
ncbi:MAG: hypothetical protein J5789_05205 [Oscillospiraceae bacterium]|nr:hypothetical protein [Oscillospiraceae bacterium]